MALVLINLLRGLTIPLTARYTNPFRPPTRLLQQTYPVTNFNNLQFYADVYVGTPPVAFRAIVDTGSRKLVLPNSGCSGCTGTARYDVSASSTGSISSEDFTVIYVSGPTSGKVGQDVVSFNSTSSFVNLKILLANTYSVQGSQFEGIFGLGQNQGDYDIIQ